MSGPSVPSAASTSRESRARRALAANEGTAPDFDVENWPKDVIAGRDPQLERAMDEALRLLKEKPVERRTTEPPPPTWGKRPGM